MTTATSRSLFVAAALLCSLGALAQSAQQKADARPDEGITGPVHQKNTGKILFATAKIDRASMNTNEGQYKKVFNVGDIIYGRFYLAKGINKYLVVSEQGNEYENETSSMGSGGSWADAYFLMFIDGKPYNAKDPMVYKSEYPIDEGKFVTTGQTRIVPNAEDGGAKLEVTQAFNALSDGDHEVRIDMYSGSNSNRASKAPIATGSFTLKKAKGAIAKIGKSFEGLEQGMKDADLEAKMLKVAQKKATDEHWKEKIMKAKISSEDWDIRRNELTSRVTGRVVHGWVYAVWPDGHCGYEEMSFIQNHDGTNFQNALYFNSIGGQYECDCSK